MKNYKYFLLVFIGVFCLVSSAHINAETINKKIIIIPPLQYYLTGFQSDLKSCKGCSDYSYSKKKNTTIFCKNVCKEIRRCQRLYRSTDHLLLSDLGKAIYLNMIEGITLFNKKTIDNDKGLVYQLNTQNVPIANCKSNSIIRKFYEEVLPDKKRLIKNLKKKNSDAFVWVEYGNDFNTELTNCMQYTRCNNKEIPITISLFDAKSNRKSKQLNLKFKKNYLIFSIKSLKELKESVCSLLYDNKFPPPVKEKKETVEKEKKESCSKNSTKTKE